MKSSSTHCKKKPSLTAVRRIFAVLGREKPRISNGKYCPASTGFFCMPICRKRSQSFSGTWSLHFPAHRISIIGLVFFLPEKPSHACLTIHPVYIYTVHKCICINICICIYIFMDIYIYTRIYINIYLYIYICIYMYMYMFIEGEERGGRRWERVRDWVPSFKKLCGYLFAFPAICRCIGGALVQGWVHDQEDSGTNLGQNPFGSFFRRKIPAYGRAKFAGNSRREEESRTGKNRQFWETWHLRGEYPAHRVVNNSVV